MQTYGILAHPTGHSLSPLIHNAAFKELAIEAEYVVFDIKPEDLESFVQFVRDENIEGLSVSIPHKIEVMKYLDEVDEKAQKIGAVNTVFWKNDKLCGTNTDVDGAMMALEEKTDLKDKKVCLFGSGGAARAIAYGLKEKGAQITIIGTNLDKAKSLACPLHCIYGIKASYKVNTYDIVINATPVGMSPNIDKSILNAEDLHKGQVVFDIVYNPLNTKLIQEGQKAGCINIKGERMFLLQAVKQFEIWTEKEAPIRVMEEVLLEKLK